MKKQASVVDHVRRLCLALPEATEKEAWATPTFRVRDKMFAMVADNHHGDGRLAVWVKAPPGEQEVLIGADPERFFKPPYVGPSGWIGINLEDGMDWDEVADHLREGYLLVAPKRVAAALTGPNPPPPAPKSKRVGRPQRR